MTGYQLAGVLILAAAFILSHLGAGMYWYGRGRRRERNTRLTHRAPRALR